jgi:quinol monooxygenase YgiN
MTYGYVGSMKTRPGQRDDVVAILLGGADGLRDHGCHLYVVSVSDADEDTIWERPRSRGCSRSG